MGVAQVRWRLGMRLPRMGAHNGPLRWSKRSIMVSRWPAQQPQMTSHDRMLHSYTSIAESAAQWQFGTVIAARCCCYLPTASSGIFNTQLCTDAQRM